MFFLKYDIYRKPVLPNVDLLLQISSCCLHNAFSPWAGMEGQEVLSNAYLHPHLIEKYSPNIGQMANWFKPSYEILCLHISVLHQHNGKHNTTHFPLSRAQPGSHLYTLIRRNLTGTNTIGIASSSTILFWTTIHPPSLLFLQLLALPPPLPSTPGRSQG